MATKNYILYKHTAPNGKVYIGITCKSAVSRWGADGSGYKRNPHFWSAIQKYGWDNIKHEIILSGLSKDEACDKEREYISRYNANDHNHGYNMTSGGESGFVFHQNVVEKISSAAKRQWQEMTQDERDAKARRQSEIEARRTPEEKLMIREKARRTMMGRYSPEERAEMRRIATEKAKATRAAKGGKSPEERASISARMKKYWDEYHALHPKKKRKYRTPKCVIKLSREESRARMSEITKRKWRDPEYREKVSKSCGSRGHHWSLSEETKARMRKPKSKETRRKMSEAKKRKKENTI